VPESGSAAALMGSLGRLCRPVIVFRLCVAESHPSIVTWRASYRLGPSALPAVTRTPGSGTRRAPRSISRRRRFRRRRPVEDKRCPHRHRRPLHACGFITRGRGARRHYARARGGHRRRRRPPGPPVILRERERRPRRRSPNGRLAGWVRSALDRITGIRSDHIPDLGRNRRRHCPISIDGGGRSCRRLLRRVHRRPRPGFVRSRLATPLSRPRPWVRSPGRRPATRRWRRPPAARPRRCSAARHHRTPRARHRSHRRPRRGSRIRRRPRRPPRNRPTACACAVQPRPSAAHAEA
jgi:hypothetical protein